MSNNLRRTNNPRFVNVPLTNGAEFTLNLEAYDPAAVEKRKGYLRIRLRSAQIVLVAMEKEELDAAYTRYQEHAAKAAEGKKA